MRWLFAVLALATLTVELPFALPWDRGWVLLIGLASAATLASAWSCSYLWRRVPVWLDVIEVAALLGFGWASRSPGTVLGVVVAAMWFRAFYGSTLRSAVRCALYMGVVVLAATPWTGAPGQVSISGRSTNPGLLLLILLTLLVGREMGRGLAAREQSLRGHAALAAAGSRLIGMTDRTAIRALAWDTAVDICSASPGLRLLRMRRSDSGLRVDAAAGTFDISADPLPAGLIGATAAGTVLTDAAPLNLAAGATLDWVVLDLPQQDNSWLLVGAPNRVPADALLAVRSLVNQVILALSNGDVRQNLITQASVDSLTGLANRAAFTADLSAQLGELRDGAAVQVLFLDLDDFKNVNDVLGHQAGDLLLQEVALRLRRSTRPTDLCARLGGDEFAIILPDTAGSVAMDIAQRTVDAIAQPMRLGEHNARVGASIGVATATAGTELEVVVHQADIAMYAAKARGKGRTQLFRADLVQDDTPDKAFARDLAGAAAAGQLVVHYQPILTLPQLRCTAVEALVRWQHPEQGLLPPDDFIRIAEDTEAITAIGAFVLGQACSDTVTWQREHPGSPLTVHVNVSAKQLDDPGFIALVTRHLAESGLPAGQLVLELTETVALNAPAGIRTLRDLAGLGVQIAIDDFGTGYSSLTTLRALPVNVVKLDRTFVDGALTNATDRAVITAIVQMSRELGLHTIAEGVERPEQRQFLQDIGTDAVQGYLHLRPVPAEQFATWLTTNLRQQPETAQLRLIRRA